MRTAFVYAEQVGARAVVQVDADGQHDPRDIPRPWRNSGDHSVVIGERFGDDGYHVRGPTPLGDELWRRW